MRGAVAKDDRGTLDIIADRHPLRPFGDRLPVMRTARLTSRWRFASVAEGTIIMPMVVIHAGASCMFYPIAGC